VRLVSVTGAEAQLEGVIPLKTNTHFDLGGAGQLKESAQVHQARLVPRDSSAARHTIEWLANFPDAPFIWPDILRTTTLSTTTRSVALDNDGITISRSSEQTSSGRSAAKLTIEGETLYLCSIGKREPKDPTRPGCIIYAGTPDDLFRKKVRVAVSFTLGANLVELGHTTYDGEWRMVSAVARSGYSPSHRAFDQPSQQLAPLGWKWQGEMGHNELTRMVAALVSAYDTFDLGNLSWAYWHACITPLHHAPAQFGAAIEALQRAYAHAHRDQVRTTILPRDEWRKLRATLQGAIAGAGISPERTIELTKKLGSLNNRGQRSVMKAVLEAVGLRLGEQEGLAWERRDSAAHGAPIAKGDELIAIHQMKLLRGLFHRMLLRMTDAAEFYIDYASVDHPYRRLSEPPTDRG